MVEFVSLDSIVYDIINTARANNVSESETLSFIQVESWVHEYRAKLLKQDLDKGKYANPDYIQSLEAIRVIVVEAPERTILKSGTYNYRTEQQIPKTIDLNYRSGFIGIEDVLGNEIHFMPQGRTQWQKHKKYTALDTYAWLNNRYLYITSSSLLHFISVRGIFEVPSEAGNFTNELISKPVFTSLSKYPIPINMVPVLKQMIFENELKMSLTLGSDLTNDSNNKIESNEKAG
jgi:hypothetical protein